MTFYNPGACVIYSVPLGCYNKLIRFDQLICHVPVSDLPSKREVTNLMCIDPVWLAYYI